MSANIGQDQKNEKDLENGGNVPDPDLDREKAQESDPKGLGGQDLGITNDPKDILLLPLLLVQLEKRLHFQ